MGMDPGVMIGLLLIAFFVWGVPIIFVVTDPIVSSKEKAIWVFAIGLASWVAWFLYRFVAPIMEKPRIYSFDNKETRGRTPPAF